MLKKLLGILSIIIFLSACGPRNNSTISTPSATASTIDSSITMTDGLGRVVTLPEPAQRVVSLAPSNTEILFAIGAGAQVVGRDDSSDYPAEAQSLPSVGGYSGYSSENIVALHPDLVLAAEINSPELIASLEQLGLTVYMLPNPVTLEDMYATLETVARLTGHEEETTALIDSLKARVAVVDAKIRGVTEIPRVYYEIDATDPTKPYTYGPGSFGELLIQRAGGTNIGSVLDGQWAQISVEQVVIANPQIIVLGDSAWGETPEKVSQRPGWQNIEAVVNHQVHPFDDNLISRPGPRQVDGLEALARLLHPELFQ